MRIFRTGLMLFVLLFPVFSVRAQGLSISQIDTDKLLFGQTVRLYVSAPLAELADDSSFELQVWESGNGKDYAERPIRNISRTRNVDEGIHFYLLLDNSGSMWDGLDGQPGVAPEDQRMTHAKNALRRFIGELSPRDSVGLAVFNTRYWVAADPLESGSAVERSLEEIRKPFQEDAYTELYLSIHRALDDFSGIHGRRVLIVLSDGENFPYFAWTGKPNPESGVLQMSPEEVLDRAHMEGISVYVVHFGDEKDPDIASIALGTGAQVFDASNQDELANVYSAIRSDILNEISVDYTASMESGSRRYVRVLLRDAAGTEYQSDRFYYAGTVLGWNDQLPPWYFWAFILIPAAVWLSLLLFRMEKDSSRAAIRLMYGPTGKATQIFPLTAARTVIGSSAAADITIAGNKAVKEQHASIVYDKTRNSYTLIGDSSVTVNNRTVAKKELEPGDVINMSGTVAVFDDALVKALDKRRAQKKKNG